MLGLITIIIPLPPIHSGLETSSGVVYVYMVLLGFLAAWCQVLFVVFVSSQYDCCEGCKIAVPIMH